MHLPYLGHARPTWFAALLCYLLVGCSDSSNPLSSFQPEQENAPDSFSLQATGVANATTIISYSWQNTGRRATINHATTTAAGSAVLVVKDAAGTTVYSRTLSPSLNEPTATGITGKWSIQLTLTSYSGTLNFAVQKL